MMWFHCVSLCVCVRMPVHTCMHTQEHRKVAKQYELEKVKVDTQKDCNLLSSQ